MAKETVKLGSVKRFGPRYGRIVKERLAKIEKVQHSKHMCPYCRSSKVKRQAVGIWYCRKCKAKFTGKAYSLKKLSVQKEKKEEAAEAPKEEAVAEEE
ncbi:50S ribosomal protein L37ae [Candidatus Woesearchaeota archaeon]|nr:50S ribosomal protein L37ae [Candidatus Woesearchaeota archaeon]